jgi:integrase
MYMTVDGRGGYYVRSPFKKVPERYGADARKVAIEAALLLAELVERERRAALLDTGKPTIGLLVDRYLDDKVPFMPWKQGTRVNNVAKLKRIRKELGHRLIERTDSIFLNDWLESFVDKADTWMKWRYVFILLWKHALFRKWAVERNEGEHIPERSISLVIESNQKDRQPLSVEGLNAIRARAPPWLQLAMDISLLTLQGRNEVVHMRFKDFRGGFLFVIREKVNAKSDAGFIKIRLTVEIEAFKSRGLLMNKTASPYVVHYAPQRHQRDVEGKKGKHWTFVIPNYLTNAFAEARDASGFYDHLTADEKPSFHEVRGLGARRYEALGVPKEVISALMTHSDPKTTDIYLKGGVQALSDSNYITVAAPLTLAAMLG